jgi:hypothetical protein
MREKERYPRLKRAVIMPKFSETGVSLLQAVPHQSKAAGSFSSTAWFNRDGGST